MLNSFTLKAKCQWVCLFEFCTILMTAGVMTACDLADVAELAV